MNGAPKPVVTGKKGNVGGIATGGRHGSHVAAMHAGMKNLISPGAGTNKTPVLAGLIGSEKQKTPVKTAGAMKSGPTPKVAGGSPKLTISASGKGIEVGIGFELHVGRDAAGVAK